MTNNLFSFNFFVSVFLDIEKFPPYKSGDVSTTNNNILYGSSTGQRNNDEWERGNSCLHLFILKNRVLSFHSHCFVYNQSSLQQVY